MKKGILLITFIFILSGYAYSQIELDKPKMKQSSRTSVENGRAKKAKYIEIAKNLNMHLPAEMADGVRLDKAVAASGNVFEYHYTLLQKPAVSASDFVKATKPAIVLAIKDQPDLEIFEADEMTISYIYRLKDGSLYAKINITPKDYK